MKRVFAAMLLLALLTGCGAGGEEGARRDEQPPAVEAGEGDLMEGVEPRRLSAGDAAGLRTGVITDFGLRLFQAGFDGSGNTLVSPLSVLEALAMTANGAAGDTLAQMEEVFGLDIQALNESLHGYAEALPDGEGGGVRAANGVWLNADAGLAVEPAFLQANADYYGAGVYERPFDAALAEEINGWVSEHTEGRITSVLDEAPTGAVTYLVNALTFDGVWEEIYRADQVQDGTFTTEAGEERDAQFMWSTEQAFLRDENAVGFLKYYEGRDYAFAALLPEEGVALADYIASLTGERLQAVLDNADESVYVNAAIPKFSGEYGAELQKTLADMGMADAFDPGRADFSRLGTCEAGDLYIGRVLHKTFVNVDEKGTEAGAATAVEVRAAGLLGPEERVHLDRPFLYMLIDCRHNAPLFIGAVTDMA